VWHPYSAQEKEDALARLDEKGGNFTRTAREIGITVPTLRKWKRQDSQGSQAFQSGGTKEGILGAGERKKDSHNPAKEQSHQMEKFVRDAWSNIHSLNSPKFVKNLKTQALKRGHLKEVFASISILVDKMFTLSRLQLQVSEKAKSDELPDNLTEEDIEKLIAEEEKKAKKQAKEETENE